MRNRIESLKLALARGPAVGPGGDRVMEMLCGTFGGKGIQLLHLDRTGEMLGQWAYGYGDGKLERDYQDHYHAINPKVAAADFSLPVMTDAMILDLEAFRRSEFHGWYSSDCGLCDNLAFHISEADGSVLALSVGRATRFGTCGEAEVAAAREIRPYLASWLSLSRLVTAQVPFIEALLANETADGSAWIVCDDAGSVLAMSDRAERRGLRVSADGSCAITAGGSRVDLSGLAGRGLGTGPGHHRLPTGEILSIVPMAIETLLSRRRAYLVRITGRPWPADFTLAEREIAALLIRGASPRQISASRGVSYHTVRNQVMTMRDKTGTATLAALVARLLQP